MTSLPIDHLISFFKSLDISRIHYCPGGRNYKLISSLKDHFDIQSFIDEREAAFYCLGRAKSTQEPQVLIVTSGSALINTLPAMSEAFNSNQKIIIVSADRPQGYVKIRAEQTLHHEEFSKPCRRLFLNQDDLYPIPKIIDYPLHINFHLSHNERESIEIDIIKENQLIDLISTKNNILLFLSGPIHEEIHQYLNDNLQAKISIYSDIFDTSAIEIKQRIKNEFLLDSLIKDNQFDLILRMGNAPITSAWRRLNQISIKASIIHIDDEGLSRLSIGKILKPKTKGFYYQLLKALEKSHSRAIPHNNQIQNLIIQYPKSEISILSNIIKNANKDDHFFFSNSMTIRLAQMLERRENFIHAHRGINGIDGLIASSMGIADSIRSNLHLIIGDISFIYNYNYSLFKLPKNLKIHILNNSGGQIFNLYTNFQEMVLQHQEDFTHPNKNIIEYKIDNNQTKNFLEKLKESHL